MDPLLIAFGLGVGVLVGTTGMGGGSLMTPLLILVVGIKPVVAVGTDLAYGAVTKTVGGWRHFRQGGVDLGLSGWLAIGSVPGALGGVIALELLRARYGDGLDEIVLVMVAGALLLTGALVLARALLLPRLAAEEVQSADLSRGHRAAAVAIGLCVGLVLGVTSAGSGTLIAVALILVFRLAPRRVVGTDVFHAAILLWVAAAAHLTAGNVDLALAGNILVGSVPGVWIGSALSHRMPERGLRPALGVILLASGLALASKAGAAVPPVAVVAAPLTLGALAWVVVARTSEPLAPAAEGQ